MVQGLSVHLSLKVIEMNDIGRCLISLPDLRLYGSRGTREFRSSGRYDRGFQTGDKGDGAFDVSFLSYAASKAESIENALRARDWLLYDRKDTSFIHRSNRCNCGSNHQQGHSNRPEWERRHGFDVEFRITNIIETEAEVIEKVTVKEMN